MDEPIRFAIVGAGGIGATHARAIAAVPGARLVAVAGRRGGSGAHFAAEHGVEFVTDVGGLAQRADIDAAVIATPSGAHEAAALPFLRAGKAVLCEKPLEVTLAGADRMIAAADEHGAVLAAVLQFRLGAGARAMRRAVDDGRFGRLTSCSAYLKWWRDQAYYDSAAWRGTCALDGGGAMMNQGIHAVDLLQWLAGMPTRLVAFAGCLAHERIEVEDAIAVALEFPNGALGVIEASTACRPGASMRIELCGDRGSAMIEDDRIVRWQFADPQPGDDALLAGRVGGSGVVGGGSADPLAIATAGHRLLIDDLVGAIRDRRPPLIPGSEARHALQIILAAYQSARTGEPVPVR